MCPFKSGVRVPVPILVMTGDDCGIPMVNRNEVLAEAFPSWTATEMRVEPVRFAMGVTIIVRLEPLPPKAMLVMGRRNGLDEIAESDRVPADVSGSPIVTGMEVRGVLKSVI